MRKASLLIVWLCIVVTSGIAQARDTKHLYSIADAMNTAAARETFSSDIAFYFGDQKHPAIQASYDEDFTNKKTNAFNKTDKEACEWVFLSAMLQLQKRALQLGANAVVNIESYYKKIPFKSETEYECHAGALMAGVALRGKFVKLGR